MLKALAYEYQLSSAHTATPFGHVASLIFIKQAFAIRLLAS